MTKGTVTIQEAIRMGRARIWLPLRAMFIITAAIAILLLIAGYGWVSLLIIVAGICCMVWHAGKKRIEWRLWAYQNVADIHQLQRSAELAAILKLHSYNKTGATKGKQADELKKLIARFDEEQVFEDDVSVPQETVIRPSSIFSDSQMLFKLNDEGITSGNGEFVPWSDVQNERIASVTYSAMSPRTGGEISAGGKRFFRYECSLGRMEYPMSSLDIETWKLDLLLYIYRGRYEAKRNKLQH